MSNSQLQLSTPEKATYNLFLKIVGEQNEMSMSHIILKMIVSEGFTFERAKKGFDYATEHGILRLNHFTEKYHDFEKRYFLIGSTPF